MIESLMYETKGLPSSEKWKITRRPSEVEFALGIFKECLDPLIAEAVLILAEKGYNPASSCQGHCPRSFLDAGYIVMGIHLTGEALVYFESRGYPVKRDQARVLIGSNIEASPEDVTDGILQYYNKQGIDVIFDNGIEPTSPRRLNVKLTLPHNQLAPEKFMRSVTELARGAPIRGQMFYWNDQRAQLFRADHGYGKAIPGELLTDGYNPYWTGD